MAIYQTGTATTLASLFSQLQSFAVANGWAIDYAGNRTSGNGIALQVSRGAVHATFLTDTTAGTAGDPGPRIGTYAHDPYQPSGGTETQLNRSAVTWTNDVAVPLQTFHFFCDSGDTPPYLYVALETIPGTYKHLGVGQLEAMGVVTNGVFAYGPRWNYLTTYVNTLSSNYHSIAFDNAEGSQRLGPSLQVRADSDGITPRWLDAYSSAGTNNASGGFRNPNNTGNRRGTVIGPMGYGASEITGRAILTPCWLTGQRAANLYSPLGYPPGIRWVQLDYLSPGEILDIGGDRWICLPLIRKNGGSGLPNSATYGYAYRIG